MSELGDIVALGETIDRRFDENERRLAAQDAKLAAHDRALAAIDQSEKTLENMITVLQDGMREEFRRLRLGIGLGSNGRE